MASLRPQVFLKTLQNITANHSPFFMVKRTTVAIVKKPLPRTGTTKHRNLIESTATSLAARGFLRFHKPYTPAEDVSDRITTICQQIVHKDFKTTAVLPVNDKFALLNSCFKEFNHSVPNSLLHRIETIEDVVAFYKTEVSTLTPLDEMRKHDLPPNLHIQYDYVRFHPETDGAFNGVTAFPTSSTVVTGLKYKGKYKGHSERPPHYYDNYADYIKETK